MKKKKRWIILHLALVGFGLESLLAAPVILTVTGKVATQEVVQIQGIGFADKVPAAPYLWADFDSGIDPSSLGVKKAWDGIQSMQWSPEGANGTSGIKASDGSGVWTMGLNYDAWTKEGQKMYIFKRQKMNFEVTNTSQNWKIFRMWPPNSEGYPNLYAAANNGRVFVENIGAESGFWGSFQTPSTDWATEETLIKASSAIDVKDGLFSLRENGVERTHGTILTRSTAASQYMTVSYPVHSVAANKGSWSPAWSTNNRLWVDDVYVDTTWSRVMLGNAAVFSACTKLDIQIPTDWSSTSITVTARTNSFSPGSTAYLYVFDKDGNVNLVGYPLQIGSSVAAGVNQAPVVSAGPDQMTSLFRLIPLNGSVTDDGLPSGNLTSTWKKLSGPGNVIFTNPNQPATTVRFSSGGTYALFLSGTDGSLTTSDLVVVKVTGIFVMPIIFHVVAGKDLVVQYPGPAPLQGGVVEISSATVGTTASDATFVTTNWTKASGPGTVTFADPADLATTVSFSAVGRYVLRLTVSEGGVDESDDVNVNVVSGAVSNSAAAVNEKNIFNPARGESFEIPPSTTGDGALQVTIFDRKGNRIRYLSGGLASGVSWDGRNDQGSMVASGIYIVSRTIQGRTTRSKVIVMK